MTKTIGSIGKILLLFPCLTGQNSLIIFTKFYRSLYMKKTEGLLLILAAFALLAALIPTYDINARNAQTPTPPALSASMNVSVSENAQSNP
jgi:hypothetical protein